MTKYISPEGLEKLKNELKDRKTNVRQEIAARLEESKGLGDLSENAEYQSTREAQAFNEGRIIELEDLIKKSIIINPDKKYKKVQVGSTIDVEIIKKKGNGPDKRSFNIVGSQEADPARGMISNESPLGEAFFSKEVGDIIEVETPKGKVGYKIIKIR